MSFPILHTERLKLREIVPSDAPYLYSWFSLQKVTQYYGQQTLKDLKEADRFIEHFHSIYQLKQGIRWGIECKETKELIGTIGFNAWLPKYKRAEIGYELHPNYWRKGFLTEAMPVVLSNGFTSLGLNRIGAVVFVENHASNALLKKLGFEREGMLRDYMIQDGIPHDVYMYSLLRESLQN